MGRRTGLREFQLSVAERLRTAAASRTALSSKLGFQVGADNWFVALHQVSEVIPVPPAVSVPLTHSWFRGVANVRGNLYSIIDFSAFQGGEPIGSGMERRVSLVSDRLVGGAGLRVSRMLGLRNPEQFNVAPRPAGAAPWVGGVFADAGGTRWLELDLPALVREQRFLEVGA
ncbi:MAG TPA: chemotaxis protein CheW [Usitatibacter sp.]|nr:chemotaxis protein CheW [Usitatibacter sp.]